LKIQEKNTTSIAKKFGLIIFLTGFKAWLSVSLPIIHEYGFVLIGIFNFNLVEEISHNFLPISPQNCINSLLGKFKQNEI